MSNLWRQDHFIPPARQSSSPQHPSPAAATAAARSPPISPIINSAPESSRSPGNYYQGFQAKQSPVAVSSRLAGNTITSRDCLPPQHANAQSPAFSPNSVQSSTFSSTNTRPPHVRPSASQEYWQSQSSKGPVNHGSLESIATHNYNNTSTTNNNPNHDHPNSTSPWPPQSSDNTAFQQHSPQSFRRPLATGRNHPNSFAPFPPPLSPLTEQQAGYTSPQIQRPKEPIPKPSSSYSELRSGFPTTRAAQTTPASPISATTQGYSSIPSNSLVSNPTMADKAPATNTVKAPATTPHKPVPRTSSIDSAISSISAISHSHKSSLDPNSLTSADIANIIAAGGSSEAVIKHLLKEKQQAVSQNAQLWKLVDKQRAMVLSLNKDLERTTKDKDRYRKKLKELQTATPPLPLDTAGRGQNKSESEDLSTPEKPIPRDGLVRKTDNDKVGLNGGVIEDNTLRGLTKDHPDSNRSTPSDFFHTDKVNDEASRDTPSPKYSKGTGGQLQQHSRSNLSPTVEHSSNTSNKSQTSQKSGVIPPPARRPPPAPLQLDQSQNLRPQIKLDHREDSSGSDYDDAVEANEILSLDRGRKKTRAEDDKLREVIMVEKEKEIRSRSNKKPKNIDPPELLQREQQLQGFPGMGLPSSPRGPISPQSSHLGGSRAPPPMSLASSKLTPAGSDPRHLGASPPMSPGLPQSPRPGDRPMNSPAPRIHHDHGSNTPSSMPLTRPLRNLDSSLPYDQHMDGEAPQSRRPSLTVQSQTQTEHSKLGLPTIDISSQDDTSIALQEKPSTIYRGLVSEDHPGLLLPPNSLPSIEIKVASSRLRPSRQSYMAVKPLEEDPVFTLSVLSRSNRAELWRVEKAILALPQLDHHIKQVTAFSGRLPERSIFSGHSPAKVDARRAALNSYFGTLLDTPMDDKAGLVICRFLSEDVIEPRNDETSLLAPAADTKPKVPLGPDGKPMMEGYLTKKGKNFGGWKSRYFVLHGPELKYYETPGGPHLGTIKIHHAQIGKQSSPGKNQPSSQADDDSDNQYRHAFLILEPKKKDSAALVRHVLCAESDQERDLWVHALLGYVENQPDAEKPETGSNPGSNSANRPRALPSNTGKGSKELDSPDSDNTDAIQALSYDDVVAAEAPVRGHGGGKPSPPLRTGSGNDHIQDIYQSEQNLPMSPSYKSISAPTNGVKIQDPGAWGNKGNKPRNVTSTKEKKRSIWGFRAAQVSDPVNQVQRQDSMGSTQNLSLDKDTVRPAFGLPLAEAVEFCSPRGNDSDLPAVVYRCLEYLRANKAECEEGIFRLSGSNVVIKALKERFNVEGDLDFSEGDHYYDVHAVASLFKQYLRELPTTVLTKELHLDFIRVLDLDDKQKKIAAFHTLVHRLPPPNLTLLKALSQFLIIVVNNSDVNKMTVRNVGIVFAPTLNIPAPVFSMFLSDFDLIFGDEPPPEVRSQSATEYTDERSAESDEIRSPRHQMYSSLPTPSYDQFAPRTHGMGESGDSHGIDPNGYRDPREMYDTGFNSMHQSHDQQTMGHQHHQYRSRSQSQQQYHSMNDTLSPPSQPISKSKRRESSMLFMSMGNNNRKSSIPKTQDEKLHEDTHFD